MAMLLVVLLVTISICGGDAKKSSGKKCESDADCPLGLFRYSCELPGDSASSSSQRKCQEVPEPQTECHVVVCEGGSMQLSCPAGKTLSVLFANYGRLDGSVCPHSAIYSTDCVSPTSEAIVTAACNGQQTCLLRARNSVFEDRCSSTYKYLEVTYICQ